MKYEKELELISETVKEAAEKLLTQGPRETIQKSEYDLVTDVDRKIETFISESIREAFPEDIILGEEWSSGQEIAGRTWTIDPIDGTCNFAQNIPLFGIQCSLIDEGELVLGIIYLPMFDEMYTAVKGCGCYCNGKRIEAAGGRELNNAIISVGDYSHSSAEMADLQHKVIGKMYPQIAKIRMFGSACIDFAFAAVGKTDGTLVLTKNLWDLLPGIIMYRETGREVFNLEGRPYSIGDFGAIAVEGDALEMIGRLIRNNDASHFVPCSTDL